jgi:predicted nucleotidyltransferase
MDMEDKSVLEGFALETWEGLIFTVKGCVHPDDRWFAYLRYLPDQSGDRSRNGRVYRRIYQFADQNTVLSRHYPWYLGKDPCLDLPVQWVEKNRVRNVYDPIQRLADMTAAQPRDPVEKAVVDFGGWLRKTAGIAEGYLGISGSVLFALHRPESDLDFVVYGDEPSRMLHKALAPVLDWPSQGPVCRLRQDELVRLHQSHAKDTPLSFATFAMQQNRKVNEGIYRGMPYFIRFIKAPEEVGQRYGDPCFLQLGTVTIRARIVDDRDAIFTPCTYGIDQVDFLEGKRSGCLKEIVSFRGRFADQVHIGERATARGSLELVTPRSGSAYSRVVIGGTVGDYLMRSDA